MMPMSLHHGDGSKLGVRDSVAGRHPGPPSGEARTSKEIPRSPEDLPHAQPREAKIEKGRKLFPCP